MTRKTEGGGGHTGWSATWQACLYARLRDSTAAWTSLENVLQWYTSSSLLGLHPPLMPSLPGETCITCFRESIGRLVHDSASRAGMPASTTSRGMSLVDNSVVRMLTLLQYIAHYVTLVLKTYNLCTCSVSIFY